MLPERLKVLIIEDNEPDRYLYKRYLSKSGYRFEFAEAVNGRTALEIWPAFQPDCVLVDFGLPDMTGLEILAAIKNGSERIPCAVVMLTGVGDERVAVEVMKTGAMDYLPKGPGIAETLHLTIRNAIDKFGMQQKIAAQGLALEASERSYRLLTESIPQMVWTANPDGSFTFANRRWFEYAGVTLDNAQSLGWGALLHPDDLQSSWAEWRRASESRAVFEIEHRLKRAADQTYRWHLSRAVPMVEDADRIAKWFGTSTDIEERKRAEKADLHKQKLESLGLLAGGIAHDFNNLLCGIMGGASLVAQSLPGSHEVQPMLAMVVSASEQAAQLTRQMLAYAGKGAFLIRHVDLSDLVRDSCALIRASISKAVHLRLQVSDHLPAIKTDPSQMQQVIMNLAINAAESIGEGQSGVVLVRTTTQEITPDFVKKNNLASSGIIPGTYVVLQVTDTGCGMDEETKTRMFDPFFTTKFTGRGLGLAAAQGIISTNKGAIQVVSALGKGTTIQVFVPAAGELPKTCLPPSEDDRIEAACSIAIIDDEDPVRRVAQAALEKSGYRVLLAESGEKGLELLQQNRDDIRLLILDMSMPGMSGREVLQQMRRLQIEVPVAVCSGHSEEDVRRHFSGLGICGVIQKPYTTKVLTQSVRSFLNGDYS